ncbi:MAG: shikimate kinase [Bacteroidales bacterium]|jgi:shikimate kinase|nr:shikimate kinase [Bacteroidales bacterium]MDD2204087.1 shikimate kinase [Bacteroidales bacterium]MDD3151783.1 shikimate kinase [Bacteroidales bacterium]MDD3913751.1 shikimate kinase [Bacteroidales bacterium]MDD4633516.1 shikimate kinase [Bacteroidales bacterium]
MSRFFLVGFSGAGKTTNAKRVAKECKLELLDTDVLIEQKMQMSISDIINQEGERTFRKIEHEILLECIEKDNFIMSTGGGLPCFYDNMDIMLNNGVCFYLKMNAKMLSQRVMSSWKERPLLKNQANMAEYIQEQLVVRRYYYERANFVVNSLGGCHKELIKYIQQIQEIDIN